MRNEFGDIMINRLKQLVTLNSEVTTEGEKHFNEVLHKELVQWPYFMTNPEHVGLYAIPNDMAERSILWGYVDKGARETILMFGHCDVVTTDNFQSFKPLAFSPDLLRKAFIEQGVACDDLEDEAWLFGRGSCDMKAGLAIQLVLLKELSQTEEPYPNILWLSVPDEEKLSVGMRSAIQLIHELKRRFHLSLPLAILSEPHDRDDSGAFTTYAGTAGKIMPMIMARGIQTHAGDIYAGFNAITLMTEIVKAVDLNTEMSDVKYREMTTPPSFLGLRDLKAAYDVTTPEYVAGFFNWTFLKNNFEQKFEQLKSLCVWSVEDAINQLNYSLNEYLRKQLKPSYQCCRQFDFEVLFLEELYERLPETFDAKAFVAAIWRNETFVDDYDFTATVVKRLMEKAEIKGPSVVIALMPPIYPAVDSTDYFERELLPVIERIAEGEGFQHQLKHYFQKISDLSYCSGGSVDYERITANCPGLGLSYALDFEALSRLDMAVVNIGPWGKDLHLKTERVYLPDVVHNVPKILDAILRQYADK
ncbi:M20/M25/M40 family metallo-hydrolase [Fusibacter paucivorans]|uniref:M20/M25/M40 family metallo-hydrolase n=1 Tax=Fusibacter paucivorans TaxID=76009 RepID=A0ABS5PQW5_9FIRM|nr:M20/M25/M40 family metallo-hydrolase [Fusibacter paucivorans]MBS7527302.1 M20/M25/M40 family metallo-hydrolase [Fusibacter paucivorans]